MTEAIIFWIRFTKHLFNKKVLYLSKLPGIKIIPLPGDLDSLRYCIMEGRLRKWPDNELFKCDKLSVSTVLHTCKVHSLLVTGIAVPDLTTAWTRPKCRLSFHRPADPFLFLFLSSWSNRFVTIQSLLTDVCREKLTYNNGGYSK